ncbi:MAG: carcinine hydrolase/isopenicillin-N N-acyltransferase family protein [Armatimonadota bacterium]
MKLAWILTFVAIASASQPCTVFLVARHGQVFAAGNEDEGADAGHSKHFVKFVQAKPETGALGYVAFGYSKNPLNDESAMNEAGLFYDFTAQDKLDKPREGKPRGKFNAINEMLTKCRTVAEAVHFLEAFDLSNMSSAELFIGDSLGASAIVERHTTTARPKGIDFQIATNFRTSLVPQDQISCERYKLCDSRLGASKRVSVKSIVEILDGTKAQAPSAYRTWYSLVCDLKRREVNLYRKGDFSQPIKFSLLAELKKGARKLDMDEFVNAVSR